MESGRIRMSLIMSKRRIDKATDCRNCVCWVDSESEELSAMFSLFLTPLSLRCD